MVDRTFNDAKYTKRAPLDTDTFPMQTGDTVDGTNHGTKGSNIKTWLKAYFDGLYHPKFNTSDDITEGSTNLFLTAQERSDIQENNGKVTNQTHTGDVTGATALTIANDAVTTGKIKDGDVTPAKLAPGATTPDGSKAYFGDGSWKEVGGATKPHAWMYALSDETTDITTGVKVTSRVPYAGTCSQVRFTLTTAGSSSTVVRATHAASNIMSDITLAASDKSETTTTIAVPAMVDDAELVFSVQTAGTGAKGLKVHLLVTPN